MVGAGCWRRLVQRAGEWNFPQLCPSCGMNKMKFNFLFLVGVRKQGESLVWSLKSFFKRMRLPRLGTSPSNAHQKHHRNHQQLGWACRTDRKVPPLLLGSSKRHCPGGETEALRVAAVCHHPAIPWEERGWPGSSGT